MVEVVHRQQPTVQFPGEVSRVVESCGVGTGNDGTSGRGGGRGVRGLEAT